MSSVAAKLSNIADVASSDAQALVVVQKLEETVLEMVASYEDCVALTQAIKAVPSVYQPSDQASTFQETNFKTLLEAEVGKIKQASSASGQNNPLFRQFRESVWNVHHAGQPMPGEEQEDIVMTSTQMTILNVTCPLTGKPVIELENPVRCVDCRHIYEKNPVMHYIRSKKPPQCPIAGCPRILQIGNVVCDPLLRIEIEELRSSGPTAPNATNVEDFTDLLDEDEDD
ncbi:hypothetical protein U9M48_044869 [Paspalum notatum var. saurae]|uniref:SP-RING-type domain-containing protein n=1 Tax=Paspalum notatum var. saurae TaxID=547442 RepID=A0AAQ3UVY4_PASNO